MGKARIIIDAETKPGQLGVTVEFSGEQDIERALALVCMQVVHAFARADADCPIVKACLESPLGEEMVQQLRDQAQAH